MDTSPNTLLSRVRSLIHEPEPDATAIIAIIQACPDPHAREVAEQYAHQHFTRLQRRLGITPYAPGPDMRMRYDVSSRILSGPDGTAIKEMCCPLEKRWSQLEPLDKQDMCRACESCQRHVYNTRGMDAERVREMVEQEPDVCLHIDQDNENVVFVSWPEDEEELELYSGVRGILSSVLGTSPSKVTAPAKTWTIYEIRATTSVQEINLSTALGYRPLLERVATQGSQHFMQLWQHADTREVIAQNDPRVALLPPPYLDWTIALHAFRYDASRAIPFLAYLIPAHLEPGTRVKVQSPVHILTRHRTRSTRAIWNGEKLVFRPMLSRRVG